MGRSRSRSKTPRRHHKSSKHSRKKSRSKDRSSSRSRSSKHTEKTRERSSKSRDCNNNRNSTRQTYLTWQFVQIVSTDNRPWPFICVFKINNILSIITVIKGSGRRSSKANRIACKEKS
ncbi:hypothetical protein KGM_214097 [Danaus plexippus plexippus]|uniref:Uncharacterized protein n=1 Tax=Danaus plexippus plexippus TaxID=278856 RepID=A0A212F7D9_DANPL|nr:hypothetical protein KGM_214097 [Danaus plexippus plexippus]